jgi:hypothetical protein
MTLQEIVAEVEKLDKREQAALVEIVNTKLNKAPQRNVMELDGLGAEVWRGIDVEQYINDMRDEWDAPRAEA